MLMAINTLCPIHVVLLLHMYPTYFDPGTEMSTEEDWAEWRLWSGRE